MKSLIQPQPAGSGTVQGLIAALCTHYRFLQRVPVGGSACGRELTALILDCPGPRATGQVLFSAAFHGQEWITALILLRFLEELCENLRTGKTMAQVEVRRALMGRTLFFVPLVNPDGADIALYGSASAGVYADSVHARGGDIPGNWQANARGVDINHNFDAGFDTENADMPTAPAARRFRGTHPESEPETASLCALCRRQRFRHVTALHTQGEEIYWQYGAHTPVASRMMAEILASASGYVTAKPDGAAAFGGFKDWFIDTFHRPGFTIEMGRGVNPLPVEQMPAIYEKAREMLLLDAML